jgi:hypothetical protein
MYNNASITLLAAVGNGAHSSYLSDEAPLVKLLVHISPHCLQTNGNINCFMRPQP